MKFNKPNKDDLNVSYKNLLFLSKSFKNYASNSKKSNF